MLGCTPHGLGCGEPHGVLGHGGGLACGKRCGGMQARSYDGSGGELLLADDGGWKSHDGQLLAEGVGCSEQLVEVVC